jgi:D-beta-D-heptose 7-phosphate kinase/D-beta-D-heptose 1-phosphate adenosyltransferase
MKIVLVTGGFDPLHSGHIEYFKAAKQLGNLLIVGINSDAWLTRKKGRAFMPAVERKAIIENLHQVHKVIEFDDTDNSAVDAIKKVKELFPRDKIIFANGGDRTKDNIPEMVFEDVEFVFGVGGTNKANSSSWILDEWRAPKTSRAWGYYRVLHEVSNHVKLKELTVNPKTCLSMQRHQDRAEHWFVAEGTATVYSIDRSSDMDILGEYTQHQHIHINRTQWHKLCNETDQPLRVIEIQYGENCVEEDIERK